MDLSIIILSYNTSQITNECLTCLKKSIDFCKSKLKNNIEVIVLDNASSDNSVETIEKNHKWVKLIKSKQNLGFSKGNNEAFKKCSNPYILLLNSDSFVKPETLFQALEFFKNNPKASVLGAKLTNRKNKYQPSAGFLPNLFNNFTWQMGVEAMPYLGSLIKPIHERNENFYSKTEKVGWIMGAFFMIKRNVYKKLGGFDENIFMYAEDLELCFRIKKAGYKIFYTPKINIVHLGCASSNHDLEKPLYLELKSILYLYKKHFSNQILLFKIPIILGCLIRIPLFTIISRPQRRKAYISALKLLF